MTPKMRKRIVNHMKRHNIMTVATVRPDGYPQATTVTYVHDGLTLYFCCDANSQKVRNLQRNRKVSATLDRDYAHWNRIRGLSLGGTAHVVRDRRQFGLALKLLMKKFPEMAKMGDEDLKDMAIVRIAPKVFSVLDYTKGFGHTDLVKA